MNISSNYSTSGFSLVGTIKSVAYSLAQSVILKFIFAFIVTYTPYQESYISVGIVLILIISNVIGGLLTAKEAQSKGWLNGAIAGALYMLILFILSSFVNGFGIIHQYL